MTGFGVHAATWCVLFAVLGLFVWLNVEWSRSEYVERDVNGWRGGTREGFPLCWWDAGVKSATGVTGDKLFLRQRAYGGWLWLGIAGNLATLALAAALAAFLSERALRRVRGGQESLPHRRRAIRPVTGVVAAAVLSISVCGNLLTFTRCHGGEFGGYSQRMGVPFVTYSASRPQMKDVTVFPDRLQTEAQAIAGIENNPRVMWRLAHWHMEGIIANAIVIMLLVIGAACASEKYLRRREAAAGSAQDAG
jgi:hypothetical protein